MKTYNFGALPENTEQSQPKKTFELIPDGWYTVISDKSATFVAKSGAECLKITFRITKGPFTGRLLFENIYLEGPSEKAAEIGIEKLGTFAVAMGKSTIKNPEDLLGHIIEVKVNTKEASGGYSAQNGIIGARKCKKEVVLEDLPF